MTDKTTPLAPGYEKLTITLTPTVVGLNADINVVRGSGRHRIRMVMPGLPVEKAQQILDILGGGARNIGEL